MDRSFERPYNARITIESSPSELKIHVPPAGVGRAIGRPLLAAVYLGIIYWWTSTAFDSERNPFGWNVIILSVGILLSILGLGPIGLALWTCAGVLEIRINHSTAMFDTRCLFFHSVQQVALEALECAKREEVMTLNSRSRRYQQPRPRFRPVPGVAIVYRNGSFLVPVSTDVEANWLMHVINEFLGHNRRSDGSEMP